MGLHPFTTENAREFSRRANEIRWSRERERKAKLLSVGIPKPIPEPAPVVIPPSELQQVRLRAIQRLESQMARLDEQIDTASDPDEWHKLTTARSKLFEPWRILSGIAMPGSLKPVQPRQKRAGSTDLPQPE